MSFHGLMVVSYKLSYIVETRDLWPFSCNLQCMTGRVGQWLGGKIYGMGGGRIGFIFLSVLTNTLTQIV